MAKCKNEFCGEYDPEFHGELEDSGYCFNCAEELACLLAEEGLPTWSAWYKKEPTP